MNLTIIGSGAMGSLFAARLSPYAAVTMLGSWPEQLAAIQQDGLILREIDGRFTTRTIHVTDQLTHVPPAELILVLVKSHQTARAARQAKGILASGGTVLTLQNGLGNREALTAVLDPAQVLSGTTSEGATMVAPGIVQHAGSGHTYLADAPNTAVPVQEVRALFLQAGFDTSLSPNVDGLLWGKLAINAAINPLTALLQVANGYLAANEPARTLLRAIAHEVTAVAEAHHIQMPFADAAAQALAVAQATAANRSSMWQDIARGAPTEIEAICGAVVRYGRAAHVPTPLNAALNDYVKRVEAGQPLPPTNMLMDKLQSLVSIESNG